MTINNKEYSEPEVRAYINNMAATVGYMEEQVKNYEVQTKKLDEENQELKDLLREIQPILHMAFFANFKDTNAANELYDKIVKIVGKE